MKRKIYYWILRMLPDYWAIQMMYYRGFKRFADLKNPRTLNEKINWRKLYQKDPRFTLFADKIAAKKEIAKIIGEKHIIPTLWAGQNPENIPFDNLQPPYVIKLNNGYGNNIFVRTAQDLDRKGIIRHFSKKETSPHFLNTREWGYQQIKPEILVEKMIQEPKATTPNDYKFFVYKGRVHFVQLDVGRFDDHQRAFFDRAWNRLPFTRTNPPIPGEVPKPAHFDEMLVLVEKIGMQFDFARVDFYDLPTGVFFGEITFYPAGGIVPFHPDEWDLKMGEPWKIEKYDVPQNRAVKENS